MFNFFNRKKQQSREEKQVNLSNIVLKNKEAIETLEKRQKHLERRIAVQQEDAKTRAAAGDKRGALFALKRKKLLEQELEQLVNAHITLEQQIITLESAQTQQIAVGALSAGVSAQKIMNEQININKLDDLIGDIQEQTQLHSEVAAVLTQNQNIAEDEELLAELGQLEAQNLDEALLAAAAVPADLPSLTVSTAPAPAKASPSHSSHAPIAAPYVASPLAAPSPTVSVPTRLSDEEQLKKLYSEFA